MKTDRHWKKVGKRFHHGICVPLFSLHTRKSSGSGTFLDLIPLIDWCKEVGFDCLQLLPIHDTGKDPSPYNPLSACALHPRYLSLWDPGIEEKKTAAYREFLTNNPWLDAYARFKALKEQFEGKHWKDWPTGAEPDPETVDFYRFLQFHCFRQMGQVRKYASEKGVFLKGDLPILLSPDSADVWAEPHLFHCHLHAGAPPDAYNQLGQHWGFPLFDWDAMRREDFRWWKQRLKTLEPLFHLYRIDHVVGFFRIWGIEPGRKPAEGSFFPPERALWENHGREILEMMLEATDLLPIAEDLGTIPEEVYRVLREFGICGTKVVRWQRRGGSYIPFSEYEPYSLTTLSTPDMDPLELWWKKFPSEAIPFAEFMGFEYQPILSAPQRLLILKATSKTPSYFHIHLLQEYLGLFPELVWPDPEEERINVPGTVLPKNWSYRFRPSLEELLQHEALKRALEG